MANKLVTLQVRVDPGMDRRIETLAKAKKKSVVIRNLIEVGLKFADFSQNIQRQISRFKKKGKALQAEREAFLDAMAYFLHVSDETPDIGRTADYRRGLLEAITMIREFTPDLIARNWRSVEQTRMQWERAFSELREELKPPPVNEQAGVALAKAQSELRKTAKKPNAGTKDLSASDPRAISVQVKRKPKTRKNTMRP